MTVKARLRVKCKNCGNWTEIEVEKIYLNIDTPETGLKTFLPAFLPLKTEKCSKCNQIIAEEEGLIRTKKNT